MRHIAIAFLILANLLSAAPPVDNAALQKAGVDPARIATVAPRLLDFVNQGAISGSVTLVQRHGTLVHFETTGYADIEAKKPMRPDTIFQIMSMTKPFVGTAIMMLAEEGKLSVSDPVEKHLPEFRGQQVIVKKNEDGSVTYKKASRPITLFDCMTHTSGMSYLPPAGLAELNEKMDRPLSEAVLAYSQMPLEFEPGSKWQYSNLGIAILGRVIETRSGLSFEDFLATRIFQPLGMKDSHIFLPADKQARLAAIYRRTPEGLAKAGKETLGGYSLNYRKGAKYSAPEWGLYTTAQDLANFYQMLLNGGVHNGKRILSKAAIRAMSSKQTGELRAGHMPNTAFGLTWEVIDDPRGEINFLSKGTYGHGGAFGTHGWIDPQKDLVGVYLVQMTGIDATAKSSFMQMVNASLLD